jgi:divalent metal cation (Fe/Co/Zn/Cd) transporter
MIDSFSFYILIGSIIIGIFLLILAFRKVRNNRGILTSSILEEKIQTHATAVHGVSRAYDIKTLDQGLSGLIVHMKIEVDPDTKVKELDDFIDRVKEQIQTNMPSIRQIFIEVLVAEASATPPPQ